MGLVLVEASEMLVMVCKVLGELMIDAEVLLEHGVLVKAQFGFPHNSGDGALFGVGRSVVKLHRGIDSPAESVGIEVGEGDAIALGVGLVKRIDGVAEAAGPVDDGDTSVVETDHLGEAAGLEGGGHEDKVARGESLTGELFFEVTDGDAVLEVMHCDDILKVAFEGAIADDNELEVIALIVGHDLMEDVGEELAALLNRVEPRGPEEEGSFVIDVEAEFFLEDDFVQGLPFVVCGGVEILSNSRIGVRVEG